MITGALKSKIDSLWEIFWTGGLTNPLDVIEQMTYLMFIRDLDDTDNVRAKEAFMLGLPYKSIFAGEVQVGDRVIDGNQLKWSVFHDFPASKMYSTVQEWVFPFIKELHGDKESAYSRYMGDAIFKVPTPLMLDKIVTAMDETGNAADIVLDYDADSNKFTTSQKVVLNGALDDWDPYQTFTQVAITKFVEVAATPAIPTFESINFVDTEYPSIYCSIPAVGTNGETLNANKLFYTVWVEKNGESQKYTFTAARYADDFDEDVVEVPYKHDGEDLYAYGEIIYFEETLDELATWSKVGIQSIYYGAGERRESDIAWMENGSTDGISDIKADRQNGNAVIYNLAGQRIANGQKPTAKGLYIINGKKVLVK